MHKVVVVGSSVLDTIVRSESLKVVRSSEVESGVAMCEVLGGKLEAEEGVLVCGGGATNVSVALKRLGESVKIVSRIGDDMAGRMILQQIEGEGVDTSMMQKGSGKTGMSVVLVNSEGARSIVTFRGESGKIEPGEIDWKMIEKADWLQISSLGGDMELLSDMVNFAFERGIRIGINPGSREIEERDRLLKILRKVEMVNLNKAEFCKFFGLSVELDSELVKNLFGLNVRWTVVTDGKRGAGLMKNQRWMWMNTFKNKSVDDTGAGDAFVSGIVKGILDNKNDEEVLKMGLANGSSVVTKLGAKEGLLFSEDIGRWMSKKLEFTEEVVIK